jgi:hypothetical protein
MGYRAPSLAVRRAGVVRRLGGVTVIGIVRAGVLEVDVLALDGLVVPITSGTRDRVVASGRVAVGLRLAFERRRRPRLLDDIGFIGLWVRAGRGAFVATLGAVRLGRLVVLVVVDPRPIRRGARVSGPFPVLAVRHLTFAVGIRVTGEVR